MLLVVQTSVSYQKEYGLHLWVCIYYVYVSSENPQVSNAECVLFLYPTQMSSTKLPDVSI